MSSSFFSQCFGYSASIMFVYTNMGIYTCFGAQGVGVEFSIRDFDFPAEPFNCFLQTCDGLRICLVVFKDNGHFVFGNQFCKIGESAPPPPPAPPRTSPRENLRPSLPSAVARGRYIRGCSGVWFADAMVWSIF